jgi:hypothetical protein
MFDIVYGIGVSCGPKLILKILLILSSYSRMSERRKPYPFDRFESKWQRLWDERQFFTRRTPARRALI